MKVDGELVAELFEIIRRPKSSDLDATRDLVTNSLVAWLRREAEKHYGSMCQTLADSLERGSH